MNHTKTKGIISLSAAIAAVCLAAGTATAGPAEQALQQMPEESIFSTHLRFQGDPVETLSDGRVMRTTAIFRGKRFEWTGKVDNLVAEVETGGSRGNAPPISAISAEELAENLRGIALFNGHQFIEADAPVELARRIKRLEAMERDGASRADIERLLPGTGASQGTAERTEDLSVVEHAKPAGENARIPHGPDDRSVMNNHSYPHRTHIVFDNTGNTSSINGSQGSGTLIGPSTAMSVAHVFWNESANTWESAHRWAPGFDSAEADSSPWGDWYACYWVTIPTAYTIYENSTYDYAVLDFDVGCNSVRNGVNSDRPGSTVGWLGFYTASTSDIESRTGYLRGYPGTGTCGNPGQSCGVRVWGDISYGSENDAFSYTIRHQADTSGGQSGSAFYHYADPSCSGCGYGAYLVGMHRAGYTNYNEATRFYSSVYSFMKSYSSDY